MTAGGRLSIALCVVLGLSWLRLVADDGHGSRLTELAGLVAFALSCPLGLLTGGLTTMHGSGSGGLVFHLAGSTANCFLLGYGLTGLGRFFRHLFSPTFP